MSGNEPDLRVLLHSLVVQLVDSGLTLTQARDAFERQMLITALRHNGGSVTRSAKALGVHRNTLRNRMVRLKIKSSDVSGEF